MFSNLTLSKRTNCQDCSDAQAHQTLKLKMAHAHTSTTAGSMSSLLPPPSRLNNPFHRKNFNLWPLRRSSIDQLLRILCCRSHSLWNKRAITISQTPCQKKLRSAKRLSSSSQASLTMLRFHQLLRNCPTITSTQTSTRMIESIAKWRKSAKTTLTGW